MSHSQIEGLKLMAALFLIAVIAVVGLAISTPDYEKLNRQNCEQYMVIPEKYIDKVPSGCVAQYFEAKQ